MSTARVRPIDPVAKQFRTALSSKVSWITLVIVVIGLLSYGSVHNYERTDQQRVNYLESVIKCPPCADISIAQSDDQQAKTLRNSVVGWVHDGWSDARIEHVVVSEYGSNELLQPATSGIDIVVWLVPLIAIVLGATGVGVVLARRRKKTTSTGNLVDDEELVARARFDRSVH